ncbi:MAG: hypothetical protein DDT30_01732 [Dehalococcoidia bacterium]|nr:hypothetical protein [Bacillota bacterium]MBT9143495.1 hypothetical protein [Bacillota bacterium]
MKQEFKSFYDKEEDVLYIARQGEEKEFVEIRPGVGLELDGDDQIIGIEILQASKVLRDIIEPLYQTISRYGEGYQAAK